MPETSRQQVTNNSNNHDSIQVKAQLLRLMKLSHRHRAEFFCYTWDFENNCVLGVSREEYSQWLMEVPKARLVKRCECWVSKRVEYNNKNGTQPQKKVIRMESYGHCKRGRMTRSLNPLALAVGKVMIDYVFMFLDDEDTSLEHLVDAVNGSINAGRLYDAQRKVQMLEQVFGEINASQEFKNQILQIQTQKQLEQAQIAAEVSAKLLSSTIEGIRKQKTSEIVQKCEVEEMNQHMEEHKFIQIKLEDQNWRESGEESLTEADTESTGIIDGSENKDKLNNLQFTEEHFRHNEKLEQLAWENQHSREYDQALWECMVGDNQEELSVIEQQS